MANGHALRAVLDKDTVGLSVVCNEPDGSACRRACSKGCEEVCYNPAGHLQPVDYCLVAEWIDLDNNMSECYAGDDALPLHDGMAIYLNWNGDYYEWVAVDANH